MLSAWLHVTTSVSRLYQLKGLRYNEALICHILMSHELDHPGEPLTATDLCRKSHILKSQMNRTLQSLEDKGVIERQRSDDDRRRVFTRLRPDSEVYVEQHEKVLETVSAIAERLGAEDPDGVIALFEAIGDAADEVASGREDA